MDSISFIRAIALLTCLSVGIGSQADSFAQTTDSTKVVSASGSPSACVTVDGIPADGSAGTPQYAPYYGGNWFSSVAAASTKFGRTLVSIGGNNCETYCPTNQHWDGSSCVPDCMPSSTTYSSSCPSGYTGNAYQTATVSCPGGPRSVGVSSSSSWDTSGCTLIPTCTPSSTTIAASCPAGYTGTAYQTVTVSCPSGSTTNSAWDTSGCTPTTPPPTCTPSSTTVPTSCPAGYTGTAYQTVNVVCPSGATTYGSLNTSGCSPIPTPPSCTPTNYTQTGACPAGQTGTATRTATQNCDGTTTYGSWDTSGCTSSCQSTTTTEMAACDPGYTGSKSRSVTVNTCTGTSYGAWVISSCVNDIPPSCPNGATDWPTCTPQTCSDVYGGEHVIGDVITLCDATGQGGAVRYDATVVCTKQIVGPGAYWKLSYSGKEPYQNGCPQNPG